MRRPRPGQGWVLAVLTVLALPAAAAFAADGPPVFFDPVVTIAPGITREVGVSFDHIRADHLTLTVPSIRLQYPVLSWLHFSLEVPAVVLDPDGAGASAGLGDLLLGGQAEVWSADGLAEVDLGLELSLPTAASNVPGGLTALRPYVAAGTKLGPLDVLGNLGYLWVLDGPGDGGELFLATLAAGYPVRWLAPFVELTLLKPVHSAGRSIPPASTRRRTRALGRSGSTVNSDEQAVCTRVGGQGHHRGIAGGRQAESCSQISRRELLKLDELCGGHQQRHRHQHSCPPRLPHDSSVRARG